MAKSKTQFLCNSCGSVHPKWMGKCPDCGTWDSLQEYKTPTPDARAAARAPLAARAQTADLATAAQALLLQEIDHEDSLRTPTGIGGFDCIFGGGVVPGSAVLVGGEPGIGKSTLLLQVADALANKGADRVLYVTSEESARQTKLRASRLGVGAERLLVLAETNVERIINQIHRVKPSVVVIDSIQMIYKPEVPAAPGSVTQLRDCCMELVYLAKLSGTAVVFV